MRAQQAQTEISILHLILVHSSKYLVDFAELIARYEIGVSAVTAVIERLIRNFQRKRWAVERSRFTLTPSASAEQPDRLTSNERGSLRSPLEAIAILTLSAAAATAERERERESRARGKLVSSFNSFQLPPSSSLARSAG